MRVGLRRGSALGWRVLVLVVLVALLVARLVEGLGLAGHFGFDLVLILLDRAVCLLA